MKVSFFRLILAKSDPGHGYKADWQNRMALQPAPTLFHQVQGLLRPLTHRNDQAAPRNQCGVEAQGDLPLIMTSKSGSGLGWMAKEVGIPMPNVALIKAMAAKDRRPTKLHRRKSYFNLV